MMSNDFNQLLTAYLSPNNEIRINAKNQIDHLLSKGDPNDLDLIFNALHNPNYNNQVKLFLSLLIKQIFDTCVKDHINQYRQYIQLRKGDIISTILNIDTDLKVINLLVISLCKSIDLFYDEDSQKDMSNLFSFHDVFAFIFNFYNTNKQMNNSNNHRLSFQSLFISFKLLKYIKQEDIKLDITINDSFISFYQQIINDFGTMVNGFLSSFQSQSTQPSSFDFEVNMQYICLYLKISKYSLNFLNKQQREQIMEITFTLLNTFLTFLLNNTNATVITYQFTQSKFLFDCIFLSNQILIKYTAYVAKVDLATIKKYAELFYIYINNRETYISICNLIQMSGSYSLNSSSDSEYKKTKFLVQIIDFFRELLQLISLSNWGDLMIFKDCYSDDTLMISDYLNQHFFTDNRLQGLLVFSIQNCLTFKVQEIQLAKTDVEDFYQWYDTLSPVYDLREKAGVLIRIIYDRYKKELKGFIDSLENELGNIIQKEVTYVIENRQNNNSNNAKYLTFEEANLKCAILSFFETLSTYYFNKKRDYVKWINHYFLNQLSLDMLNAKGTEIFSKFIMIRILTKIIDFKEVSMYRLNIFTCIVDVFTKTSSDGFEKLLSLSCIDFFYAFFDDIMPVEFPISFFQNYIYKICELLKNTSSPEIHSKTIKATLAILNKFTDEEINSSFPIIIPILMYLWQNNWNDYLQQTQSINKDNRPVSSLHAKQNTQACLEINKVRQNLIKLISIFIKRVGVFIELNDMNMTNSYFNFIYNLIGFSINVKSNDSYDLLSEGFRLILLIQDEYFDCSVMKSNDNYTSLKTPIENGSYFSNYIKIYDYLPIILDNLSCSNEYFTIQLFIIEQYISLSSVECICNIFIQCSFIDKIIFILNRMKDEKLFIDFHHIIFNFMEYLFFIINTFSRFPPNQVSHFNDFIYQFISNIFNAINPNTISSITQIDDTPWLDNSDLSIFIGGLQLANRLMYVNRRKNIISIDYTLFIGDKLSVIFGNKFVVNIMFCVQSDIIMNTLSNVNEIIMSQKDCLNGRNEHDVSIGKFIHDKYNERSMAHYLNKHERILSTWLYFFNKMNNSSYYYNLSSKEDKMQVVWNAKLEKTTVGDISDIEFKIKYYFLFNDDMNAI